MDDVWRPEVEDFIEAHDQAGNISKIRTSGFMHSKQKGIEKLEQITKESKKFSNP